MSVHEKVMGAVARGWCSPENSRKEMDTDLAMAIVSEVEKLLSGADLRAACEAELRKKGWIEPDAGNLMWRDPMTLKWYFVHEAIGVLWARDGIGGAS